MKVMGLIWNRILDEISIPFKTPEGIEKTKPANEAAEIFRIVIKKFPYDQKSVINAYVTTYVVNGLAHQFCIQWLIAAL